MHMHQTRQTDVGVRTYTHGALSRSTQRGIVSEAESNLSQLQHIINVHVPMQY